MGVSYLLRCPSCQYEAYVKLGVGYAYPMVFRVTQQAAKDGQLGVRVKKFLAEHPNGVVNPELVLAQCSKCGEYKYVSDFTMYIPKGNADNGDEKSRCSVAMKDNATNIVRPFEFGQNYSVFKEYSHRCGKCHGRVYILRDANMEELECPHCRGIFLKASAKTFWD